MCGIVAYVGPREAYPILIKGLKRLEYRGYDSAGVALLNTTLNIYKTKGKVSDLEHLTEGKTQPAIWVWDIPVGQRMANQMISIRIRTYLKTVN
jgi:glucosamine 6-phosphate synthetase-like amidotransferase/phosphosugar isomerase protein